MRAHPFPSALRIVLLLPLFLSACAREEPVELRPFPHPYLAGLAIASDCDEMDSAREFLTIERFVADTGPTPLGDALGLEVSQSFWFYDATGANRFTYFEDRNGTPSRAAPLIEKMIASGHIDCLHSYGEFGSGPPFERRDAEVGVRALQAIRARTHTTIRVWTHHGDAANTQNLGRLPWQLGDDPQAPEYHADILLDYGMKFVDQWDVTHIIGQDARRSPLDYVKEAGVLATFLKNVITGKDQVPYLWNNHLIRAAELDDGQTVYAFRRFYSSWGGGDHDVPGLAEHLSAGNLRELIGKGGFMALYIHMGGANYDTPELIPGPSRLALENVAQLHHSGELMVTTTSRLLTYNHARENLVWDYQLEGDAAVIRIKNLIDVVEGNHLPRDRELMGITFYVPSARKARVYVGDREILKLDRNEADESGRQSVGFPWWPLVFPYVELDASWVSAP